MSNYRLTLEYDGTDFEGWQVQAGDRRTVQGCLHDALESVVGARVVCMGSGRTDAGVHAEGQVASVRLTTRLSPEELLRALNARLPDDVAVCSVAGAADEFDARRDAISKHYRYRIWNDPVRSPLRERNAWWVRARLDADAMASAASALLGEHDFTSFQASGTEITSCVRRMTRAQIGGARSELTLDFEANGFLRYMVRNLVGTLVEVGRGRRSPETMKDVLAACDRGAAGPTAPARGLMLVSVRYP